MPIAKQLAAATVVVLLIAAGVVAVSGRRGDGDRADTAAAAAPLAPLPASAPLDRRIARLQTIVRAQPRSADRLTDLGVAYLQKVRETYDPAFYTRAEGVLKRAVGLAPRDTTALTGLAQLALGRHDFRLGLSRALVARRAAPASPVPYGALVDAQVELGRYDDAARARWQAMVNLRPDLASYARVSYFRELHGDLTGAVSAMRLAVSAGAGAAENIAYVQSLLGNLELTRGHVAAAQEAFATARTGDARYAPAQAGLAQVAVARGRLAEAIGLLAPVVDRLPLPQYAIALGEDELAAGRHAAARRTFALVDVERRLLQANGVNVDVELALFEADHGSTARGVRYARRAWAAAPSVRSADALGWALTRDGHPADGVRWARRALRLGWRDPTVLFHAGMSAKGAGDRDAARRWLRAALARTPRFLGAACAPRATGAEGARVRRVRARRARAPRARHGERAGPPARQLHRQPPREGPREQRSRRRPLHPRRGGDPDLPGARPPRLGGARAQARRGPPAARRGGRRPAAHAALRGAGPAVAPPGPGRACARRASSSWARRRSARSGG